MAPPITTDGPKTPPLPPEPMEKEVVSIFPIASKNNAVIVKLMGSDQNLLNISVPECQSGGQKKADHAGAEPADGRFNMIGQFQ
jgi:hypothetical protein